MDFDHSGAPRSDAPFDLAEFAWFPGGFATQAGELAALAQPERWGDPSSEISDDYSVLFYYLSNTARRISEQSKFEYRTDPRGIEVAAFNIGLFTENYEPIYGYLEPNDGDRQPWKFRGWITALGDQPSQRQRWPGHDRLQHPRPGSPPDLTGVRAARDHRRCRDRRNDRIRLRWHADDRTRRQRRRGG